MATLTVYPGMKPDGTRCSVLAQDLVTPIPNAGAVVGFSDYYAEKIAQQILLTEDPVNSGGTPIELLVAPLTITGIPDVGNVPVYQGSNALAWSDVATGGPIDVNDYGVLPENDRITNDNALRAMRELLLSTDANAQWTMVFGRRGVYKYSFNKWLCGFLDYTVDLNGSTLEYYFPEGWNITTDTVSFLVFQDNSYLFGETDPGYNWYQNGGYVYHHGWQISDVVAGSPSVTATSSLSTLQYLHAGDPVLIAGWNPAPASYPPPYQYFEYNEVDSIVGSVITLRHRVKNQYKNAWHYSTYGGVNPEYGRATLYQLRGRGRDPAIAAAVRYPDMPRNGVFKNGSVRGTWNYTDYGGARNSPHFFLYAYRTLLLENLEVDAVLQATTSEQVIWRRVGQTGNVKSMTVTAATVEIDKNITTVTIDGCRLGFFSGSQNVQQLSLRDSVFEGRIYPQAQHVLIENCSVGQTLDGSNPITIERHATVRQTSAGVGDGAGWITCPEFVNSTGQAYQIATLANGNTHVTFATSGAHSVFASPPGGFPFNKGDVLMKTDGAYYGRVLDCFYPNTWVIRWSSTPSVGHQFQRIPDWNFEVDQSSGGGCWPGSMLSARGGSLVLKSRDIRNWSVNRFFCPSKIASFAVNVTKAGVAGSFLLVRVFSDDGGQTLLYIDTATTGSRTVTSAGITGSAGADYSGAHAGTWTNMSTWRPRLRLDSWSEGSQVSQYPVYTLTINCEELAF